MLRKLRQAQRHLRYARPAHYPFEKRIVDEDRLATDRQFNDAELRIDDVAGFSDVDYTIFGAEQRRRQS